MSHVRRSASPWPLLLGLAMVAAAAAGFFGLTGVAPPDALTVVLRGGRAQSVAIGQRYFRPPGAVVISEPHAGTLQFPTDDTYRLFSRDGAEIPAAFDIRYRLSDPAPLLDFVTQSRAAAPPPPGAFVGAVLVEALRQAARPAAAGLAARAIYDTQGRALVEALTRELTLPRGVEVEIGLRSLAMSATAQRSLVAQRAEARGRRVLFIGVDAFDWALLEPLMAEGRLPAFTRLVRGGVRADLHTLSPMLSPLIWTSMATGVGPDRHGILDFFVKDPQTGDLVPAMSSARRVPAFWNIATNYGRGVNVVGWLATWPAESINGTLVSDRFGFLAYAAGQVRDDQADDVMAPATYLAEARRLAFRPEQLSFEKVTRFLDISRGELAAARSGGYKRGNLINNFVLTYATAETYRQIGVDLLRRPADITAVYFEFIDAMGHLFMPYAPPRRAGISVADFDRYRDAVKIGYVEMDRIIGSLVAAAGDSTVIMIASDHGFLSGERRPTGSAAMDAGQAARWHRDPGVLVMNGPGIRAGVRLERASVMDVAPTLIHLAGLPISQEFEGKVLMEALSAEDRRAHPVQSIDRYRLAPEAWSPPTGLTGVGDPAGAAPKPPGETGAAPTPDAAGNPAAEASTHVNLGLVLDGKGDLKGAEAEYRAALRAVPDDLNGRNNLAGVFQRTGRVAEAVAIYEEILKTHADYTAAWVNLGICRLGLDDNDGAVAAFDRALAHEPGNLRALINRGHAQLRRKEPAQAEADFRKVVQLSPGEANAHFGLGLVAAERQDFAAARRAFEKTLALDPRHRSARENLERLKGIN